MQNIQPKAIKFASKRFGERQIVEVQVFYDAASNRHEFRVHWEHGFNQKLTEARHFCEMITAALEFTEEIREQISNNRSIPSSSFDRVEQMHGAVPAPAAKDGRTSAETPKPHKDS